MPKLFYYSGNLQRCAICIDLDLDGYYDHYYKDDPINNVHNHLLNKHPEYCYHCNKCPYLDTTLKSLKKHKEEKH